MQVIVIRPYPQLVPAAYKLKSTVSRVSFGLFRNNYLALRRTTSELPTMKSVLSRLGISSSKGAAESHTFEDLAFPPGGDGCGAISALLRRRVWQGSLNMS